MNKFKKILPILFLFFALATVLSLNFYFRKNNDNTDFSAGEQFIAKAKNIEDKITTTTVNAPILIYHNIRNYSENDSKNSRTFIVPPEDFKKQMEYLRAHNFSSITASELRAIITGEKSAPAKPVVITFDDGVNNQYENAFPILKQNGLCAVFYVFANAPERNNKYLNFSKLKEMAASGMEIGSHTYFHSYLTKLPLEKIKFELQESKKRLEDNLGIKVESFAYPFGDLNDTVIAEVKNAAYTNARGIINGKTHSLDRLYNLKGYFITDDFNRFKNIVGE